MRLHPEDRVRHLLELSMQVVETRTGKRSIPGVGIQLSVIIPIYNEEENIPLLATSLFPVLDKLGYSFEIVAVNDGSRDGSLQGLLEIAGRRPEFKIVDFRRNYGQTAAMMAGIDYASGDIIVSIDADLQNDPNDIPALLSRLNEGFDVVSGWRKDRKDAPKTRLVESLPHLFTPELGYGGQVGNPLSYVPTSRQRRTPNKSHNQCVSQ